jgi:hypothetical protein
MNKSKMVTYNGAVYTFSSDWIYELETEEHWRLYWRQQAIMGGVLKSGDRLLEIGVGSGFTANYLRSKGFNVTTLDIDEEKNPDTVANVVAYEPVIDFDCILAFEVFEHIPFQEFDKVIGRLSSKCKKAFFLSLPHYRWIAAQFAVKLPKLGKHDLTITLPKCKLTTIHHQWEIGYKNIDRQAIVKVFASYGFHLVRSSEAFCREFFAFLKT